ncbi:hypothetical protein [Escherichia coli]
MLVVGNRRIPGAFIQQLKKWAVACHAACGREKPLPH